MFSTIRKFAAVAATIAAVGILASCSPAAVEASGSTPEPIIVATETAAPVEEATPEPTVEPTPEKVDLTAGLEVGDVVSPDLCEQMNANPAIFGKAYVMMDGTCRFVRYGDPVPEEVRADVEQSLQGFPADTVHLSESARVGESLGGLEIGMVRCFQGIWRSDKPNGHNGSYDQMLADTQAWVDAGTSRLLITVNQC